MDANERSFDAVSESHQFFSLSHLKVKLLMKTGERRIMIKVVQINDNIIPYQHNSMIKYWINACWAVRPGEVFFPLLWLLFISCQNDGQYSISIHYQVRFFKKICVDMSNSDTTMWQGSSFLSSNLLWKKMSRLNGAPQKLKRGSTD